MTTKRPVIPNEERDLTKLNHYASSGWLDVEIAAPYKQAVSFIFTATKYQRASFVVRPEGSSNV
jgi:hypothetical protein